MKCIIIEDQAPAQRILQTYIKSSGRLKLEMIFCDAVEAKAYLSDHDVDLVFLDVDLPRLSGMDFLRSGIPMPLTILTTAYSEFALESYQFNVVDYLLKPFSLERFCKAIDKAASMHVLKKEHLYIRSSYDLLKINKDDVLFIRSDGDYTEVITGSQTYLTSDSLRNWLTKLDPDFVQVHKSYIVNTANLQRIANDKIYLILDNVVPIGRAFKKSLMNNFKGYQQN